MLQVADIERLSRFRAGELDPAEAAAVKAELASNPELSRALRRLERLDALALEVAHAPPPMNEAQVERALHRATAVRTRPSFPLRPLALLAAAALVGVASWSLTRAPGLLEHSSVVARAAADVVETAHGRALLFEGAQVERDGDGLVLRAGSAVFEGQALTVRCGSETITVDGHALISLEPEATVAHVTRSAEPNSTRDDMKTLKAQWLTNPPSTAGMAVLLAVLSGSANASNTEVLSAGAVRLAPAAVPVSRGPRSELPAPTPVISGPRPSEQKVMLVEGMVPYPELRDTLMKLGPAAAKCFEKGRAQAPKLEGDVMLAVTIVPAATGGRAEDVQVEGYTLQHPFVVSCVVQAVMALPFPAPTTAKAKVLVPLSFRPRGEPGSEGVEMFVPSIGDQPAMMHMPDRAGRVEVNTAGAATIGPESAAVTVVVLTDFECTFCQKNWPVLEQLLAQYGSKVRFVFLEHPLPFHPGARRAAEAAVAAGQQGRFKEFAALLFAEQTMHDEAGLDALARRAGLDLQRFRQALADGSAAKIVDAHLVEAGRLGSKGTPSVFINGQEMVGARPLVNYQQAIDAELKP